MAFQFNARRELRRLPDAGLQSLLSKQRQSLGEVLVGGPEGKRVVVVVVGAGALQ